MGHDAGVSGVIDATGRYGSDLIHNLRTGNMTTPGLEPEEVAGVRAAIRNPIFLVNGLHTVITKVKPDIESLRLTYDPMCLYWNGESDETGGPYERLLVLTGSTDPKVLYDMRVVTHQVGTQRTAFTGTMPTTIVQRVDGIFIKTLRSLPATSDSIQDELQAFAWFASTALTVINSPWQITYEPAGLDRPLRRKWERKPNQRVDYRVIRLPDGRMTHGKSIEVDGVPAGISLHSVRGHFATYGRDNPLFGRLTGTYWRRPHLRGDGAYGKIGHDYDVQVLGDRDSD